MKTIILKNMMPFAILALGLVGAFATTSMQSAEKVEHIIGYRDTPQNPCSIPVPCDTEQGEVCRVSYPDGEQVFALNESQTTCSQIVYKP